MLFFLVVICMSGNFQLLLGQQKTTCSFTAKHDVYVTNELPHYSRDPLVIHCYSKDTDMKEHTLWKNQNFHWSFCEDLFFRTKFDCAFNWGENHIQITVFNAKLAFLRCVDTVCLWSARKEGIFFSYRLEGYQLEYFWNGTHVGKSLTP